MKVERVRPRSRPKQR